MTMKFKGIDFRNVNGIQPKGFSTIRCQYEQIIVTTNTLHFPNKYKSIRP